MKLARLGLPLLLSAAIWSQLQIEARLGGFRAQEEVLYLWDGEHVKRLFPGFESLMADLYWLRTVQYFGGHLHFDTERDFDLLEPLVDITTTLDPRFELAYRYGATFLAEPYPNGAGRPEAAVALLEKGVRNNPENWRLHWDLGHFRYLFEMVRPEINQYFIESNTDGRPFSRELRSVVYQRAKRQRDTVPNP